jgi:hypothetical protein
VSRYQIQQSSEQSIRRILSSAQLVRSMWTQLCVSHTPRRRVANQTEYTIYDPKFMHSLLPAQRRPRGVQAA